jgi:hypothetical protein
MAGDSAGAADTAKLSVEAHVDAASDASGDRHVYAAPYDAEAGSAGEVATGLSPPHAETVLRCCSRCWPRTWHPLSSAGPQQTLRCCVAANNKRHAGKTAWPTAAAGRVGSATAAAACMVRTIGWRSIVLLCHSCRWRRPTGPPAEGLSRAIPVHPVVNFSSRTPRAEQSSTGSASDTTQKQIRRQSAATRLRGSHVPCVFTTCLLDCPITAVVVFVCYHRHNH